MKIKKNGNTYTRSENIQSKDRDGIWHRKICHTRNKKCQTTPDGCNGTTKLKKMKIKKNGNTYTRRENIQSKDRDGIWHRKICHTSNKKWQTTPDGFNGTTKLKKMKIKKMGTLIQEVRIYSQRIGMEFGREKYAIRVIKSVKRHLTDTMELPN